MPDFVAIARSGDRGQNRQLQIS